MGRFFSIVTANTLPNKIHVNNHLRDFADFYFFDYYEYSEVIDLDVFFSKWLYILDAWRHDQSKIIVWMDYDILWLGPALFDSNKWHDDYLLGDYSAIFPSGWPVGLRSDAKFHSLVQAGFLCLKPSFMQWFREYFYSNYEEIRDFHSKIKSIVNTTLAGDQPWISSKLLSNIPPNFTIFVKDLSHLIGTVMTWNNQPFMHFCGTENKDKIMQLWEAQFWKR